MSEPTARIKVVVDRTQADRDIKALNDQLNNLGKGAGTASSGMSNAGKAAQDMGKALKGANDNAKEAHGSFKFLHEVLMGIAFGSGIGIVRTFEDIGHAIAETVRDAFKAAASFDTLKASLGTATGSMAAGAEKFKELQEWARKTPFAIDDVTKAYTTLANAGLNTSSKAMKAWGDLATAQGKTIGEMAHDIMLASEGSGRAFRAFGITAKVEGDKLRLVYRGTVQEISNDSASIQKYFYELSQNRFGDAMANQMDTVAGSTKRMHEAWEEALASFGSGFTGAFSRMAGSMEAGADSMNRMAVSAGKLAGGAFSALASSVGFLANHFEIFVALAARAMVPMFVSLGAQVGALASIFRTTAAATDVMAASMVAAQMAATGLMAVGRTLFAAIGGWPTIIIAAATALYMLGTRQDETKKTTEDLKKATDDLNELLRDPNATTQAIQNQEKLNQERLRAALLTRQQLAAELELAQQRYQNDRNNGGKGGLEMAGADAQRVTELQQRIAENNKAIADDQKAIFGAEYRRIIGRSPDDGRDHAGDPLNFGTAPNNTPETKKMISPQQAIRLLGYQLQAEKYSVGENPYFGGVTAGVHTGRGHGDGRAIDVSLKPGNDVNDPWVKAKETALAIQKAEDGFITLFNGKRYASDGSGGYVSSNIKRGANQHLDHVHIEAPGSMDSSGLQSEGSSRMTIANAMQQAAEKTAKAQKDLHNEVDKTIAGYALQGETAGKTARQIEEEKAKAQIAQIYQNKLDQDGLAIDTKRLATDQLRAVTAADAAMDAKAQNDILDRQTKRLKDAKDDQAKLNELAAGTNRMSQAQVDALRIRIAGENELEAIIKSGGTGMEKWAQSAILSAQAAEREAIARDHVKQALQDVDSLLPTAEDYLRNKDASRDPFGFENATSRLNMDKLHRDRADIANSPDLNPEVKRQRLQEIDFEIGYEKRRHMDAIDELAQNFKEKMTSSADAVADALASIIGGKKGAQVGGAVGGLLKVIGNLSAGLSGKGEDPNKAHANANDSGLVKVADGLKGWSDQMKTIFGDGSQMGSFFQGLSSVLGQAIQGMQTGEAVTPLGQAIFGKSHFSGTGAQIGGGIGQIAGTAIGGPAGGQIGALLGSLQGGVIGSLLGLDKPGKGLASAKFDPLTETYHVGNVSGNDAKRQQQASDVASGIADGINAIAQQLGATINPVKLDVKKRGDYRINGGSPIDLAKDAIAQGIITAVKEGVFGGLSDFSTRILKTATKDNLDSVVSLASNYENAMKDLKQLQDPLKSDVGEFVKQMDKLVREMTAAGATTEELNSITTYRELKLKQILDDNLSGLKDFQKALSGEGSGITDLNRLNTDLQKFSQMQADLAAGKDVKKDDFTALGQEIFQLAGSVYGTSTSAFQTIRSMLMDATQGMIDKANADYQQAIIDAQNATTQAVNIGNDHLGRIVRLLSGGAGGNTGTTSTGSGSGSNGSYDYPSYGNGTGGGGGTGGGFRGSVRV
jgi:hypothetical protein